MNRLKEIFLHNLPVKMVALVAAFVLWIFVMNDQNPATESSYSVPVVILNRPAETRVTQSAESVRIRLRAPRSALAATNADEIKAFVDLAGLEPGEHPLHVQTVIPPGIEVVSVTPETVTYDIDPIIQKRMPIRLVRDGAPPPGLAVAGIEPDAHMVTIVGPQSIINKVFEVAGVVVLPASATDDIDVDVSLMPLDDEGEPVGAVRIVPKVISAHVDFARSLSRKVVDVRPVVDVAAAPGYTLAEVQVQPAKVELAGSSAALDAMMSIPTEPIPAVGLTETTERTVALAVPEGVTVTNRMVTVRLVVKKQ